MEFTCVLNLYSDLILSGHVESLLRQWRIYAVFCTAKWAELDVRRKALLRVWNEAFGVNGYMKKRS